MKPLPKRPGSLSGVETDNVTQLAPDMDVPIKPSRQGIKVGLFAGGVLALIGARGGCDLWDQRPECGDDFPFSRPARRG